MKHTLVALLALACAAPAPSVAPFTPRAVPVPAGVSFFPPLPDSILSKEGWTKVVRRDAPFMCGPVLAWGCYTYASRKLEVVRGLDAWTERLVFEHEKVHMAFGDAHLVDEQEPGKDDQRADAIAEARMLDWLAQGVH
jgi:hypothetical protein